MTISARRSGISLLLCACALLLIVAAWHQPFNPARQSIEQKPAAVRLSGAAAQQFFEKTGEGQSLMAALTAARFGLQHEEHAPFDEKSRAGYLGMSHEQNLNAWFAEEGITVRPSARETEDNKPWRVAFRLRRYGYGSELTDVPPISSHNVTGTRIEYERSSNPKLVEWYENRAEGIEQGFTVKERPQSRKYVSGREPLRLVLAIEGDLDAQTKNNGQAIELSKQGKTGLSYSKLTAEDADGKHLAARMEASVDGREIALLVQDEGARYPIAIDPIMAKLEQELDASSYAQAEARFGFSVATDGERAVVGAWRWDASASLVDVGEIYIFSRSGSNWSLSNTFSGSAANDQCGYSVAISGTNVVYGCPGANSGAGRASFQDLANHVAKYVVPSAGTLNAGDRYGTSVAISGYNIVVGSPSATSSAINGGFQNAGAGYFFHIQGDGTVPLSGIRYGSTANGMAGSSVAIDESTAILGMPGNGAGSALVYTVDASGVPDGGAGGAIVLQPNDGAVGDSFGDSVALSGNTAVIGAPLNDAVATDAGAAYVFVRDADGNWSQQQKLTASDGRATNYFSDHAVAIQGNTIIVGAYGHDDLNANSVDASDDRGAAYIFMRNGTVWTEQTSIITNIFREGGGPGDNFGIGVGISLDTVIVGARTATAGNVSRAGAAYVYRLDCLAPENTSVFPTEGTGSYCATSSVTIASTTTSKDTHQSLKHQWRRNGVNIPGATENDYTINNASGSDTGSYDVVVSNSCGSDTSAATPITIETFALQPTSGNFGVSGSSGIVKVTAAGSSCSWSAKSNAPFITINPPANGTGNGTVEFTVAANPNPGQRTGTMTIAGLTFSVSQDGTNCSYAITPKSQTLDANASTKMVSVTASAGCKWTAKSNNSFISINSGANGTGNGTVTYTVAANFTPAQRTGTLTVAGQTVTITQHGAATPTPSSSPTATPKPTATPTATATPKPTATPTATPKPTATSPSLGNISTRLRVERGDNALIGGFIVTGTQPKKVILRAIGPSLPVSDALQNPILELHSKSSNTSTNDNWVDAPNKQAIIDTTVAPKNNLESAILTSLPANSSAYTAVVRGVNNGTGVGLVEVFDLDPDADSRLANISTRGLVQRGENAMIGGFIVLNGNQKVIVRAIGPSLPVSGALQDPVLELHDKNGAVLQSNDNWKIGGQQAEIIATTVPPTNDRESAIVRTLAPGNYTAVVRGVNNTTGVALVEVFALQ